MKKALLLFSFAVFATQLWAQDVPAGFDLSNYGVRIAPDKRVLVTLAAIDAGRTQSASSQNTRLVNATLTPAGNAFRNKLDAELSVPDDLRQKISVFLTQYRRRRPSVPDSEIVTPFIAMAYSLTPAPELNDPVITSDLPGELLDVLDFAPLVREYYRRSGIAAKLDDYLNYYQAQTDPGLQRSAREMVSELLDYLHTKPQTVYAERVKVQAKTTKNTALRNTEVREHERRFEIVPEFLAPAGNVQFLNIRDDYFVVVPPGTDLSVSDARRAYIQYVVDAIVLINAKDVSQIIPGVKQLVDERRKINSNISPDPFLAVARSLVAAIDARELEFSKGNSATFLARQKLANLKSDEEKRKVTAELEKHKQAQSDETALRLSEDYENGAVLAFYFAQQLRGVENSGFDITASMRDILLSFDPSKEGSRLAEFADARKRGVVARELRRNSPPVTQAAVVENPVTIKLLEIQTTIEAKNYSKAASDLNDLLRANSSDPRIYYNLGRVAMFQAAETNDADSQAKKILEAKNAYAGVIRSATTTTDKSLLSLTYVALARIYEFDDNKVYAIKLYDKAIELSDVSGGAYSQAIEGKQRLLKTP